MSDTVAGGVLTTDNRVDDIAGLIMGFTVLTSTAVAFLAHERGVTAEGIYDEFYSRFVEIGEIHE